tara:strand:- start:912 stop:1022 length:111 start_codon:yes stop_codon:yes gene_type:complete
MIGSMVEIQNQTGVRFVTLLFDIVDLSLFRSGIGFY